MNIEIVYNIICTHCTCVGTDPSITALTRPTSKVSMDGIVLVAI